jgi:hypothetical protein
LHRFVVRRGNDPKLQNFLLYGLHPGKRQNSTAFADRSDCERKVRRTHHIGQRCRARLAHEARSVYLEIALVFSPILAVTRKQPARFPSRRAGFV